MESVLIWFGWALAALLGFRLLLKGEIKFDVNAWLNKRQERKEEHLRSLCPHVQATKEDGELCLRSTYISPPGTVAWQCQKCGRWTHDDYEVNENLRWWSVNVEAFIERKKQIEKLGKKLRP